MSGEPGVEYAAALDGEPEIRRDEATISLAAWLGVPVSRALEFRGNPGELTRRIEYRAARRTSDPTVARRYLERRLASP